jgi:hypothetical protein
MECRFKHPDLRQDAPPRKGFHDAASASLTRRGRGRGSLLGRRMCLSPGESALHLTVASDWKGIALQLDRAAPRVAAASLDE